MGNVWSVYLDVQSYMGLKYADVSSCAAPIKTNPSLVSLYGSNHKSTHLNKHGVVLSYTLLCCYKFGLWLNNGNFNASRRHEHTKNKQNVKSCKWDAHLSLLPWQQVNLRLMGRFWTIDPSHLLRPLVKSAQKFMRMKSVSLDSMIYS